MVTPCTFQIVSHNWSGKFFALVLVSFIVKVGEDWATIHRRRLWQGYDIVTCVLTESVGLRFVTIFSVLVGELLVLRSYVLYFNEKNLYSYTGTCTYMKAYVYTIFVIDWLHLRLWETLSKTEVFLTCWSLFHVKCSSTPPIRVYISSFWKERSSLNDFL